jgi:predicted nucleotidyltransferase
MHHDITSKLKILKKKYLASGFYIIGVFGSQAREDTTSQSDIDILYNLDKKFIDTFHGWDAITQIQNIKDEIKSVLGLHVDLASADNNSETFQKAIKNELIYV